MNALLLEPMEAGKWEYNYRIAGEVKPDTYAKVIKGRETFGAPMPEEGMEHEIRGGLPERCLCGQSLCRFHMRIQSFTKRMYGDLRSKRVLR